MKPLVAVALAVPVAIGVSGIVGLIWLGVRIKNAVPDPSSANGLKRLQSTALSAQPLIDALQRYQQSHHQYPATLPILFPQHQSRLLPLGFWNGWYYQPFKASATAQTCTDFDLGYSLSVDATLNYQHSPSGTRWSFNPGTGDAEKKLPFTHPK